MNKKWVIFSLCILGIVFIFYVVFFKNNENQVDKQQSYCVRIPIIEYTSTNIPLVSVCIGDQTMALKLDLGNAGYVGVFPDYGGPFRLDHVLAKCC